MAAIVVHVVRDRHKTITVPRDGRAHMIAAYGDYFSGLIVSEVVLHDPPGTADEEDWMNAHLRVRMTHNATVTTEWPPAPPETPRYIR